MENFVSLLLYVNEFYKKPNNKYDWHQVKED